MVGDVCAIRSYWLAVKRCNGKWVGCVRDAYHVASQAQSSWRYWMGSSFLLPPLVARASACWFWNCSEIFGAGTQHCCHSDRQFFYLKDSAAEMRDPIRKFADRRRHVG